MIFVGTLAPSTSGWWHDLVDGGTHGSTYIQALKGDPARWSDWPEIRRVNPLMARYRESRLQLLEERDAARADSRLKARFLSYRLNVPTADEAVTLLTVDDWENMEQRPTPEPVGRPIVGIDLGAGAQSWSCGVSRFLRIGPGRGDCQRSGYTRPCGAGTPRPYCSGSISLTGGPWAASR